MRLLQFALLPTVMASLLLATFKASALPLESDNPCYMKTASGQVVNLAPSMCGAKARSGSTTVTNRPAYRPQPSTYHTGVSSVVTTTNGGVTTTIYSAPGYNANNSRYIYPSYNYGYSPNYRRTQTSGSVRR